MVISPSIYEYSCVVYTLQVDKLVEGCLGWKHADITIGNNPEISEELQTSHS
jgi:hypothetical protein